MARNRKKKGLRVPYTKEDWQAAMTAISKGLSLNETSRIFKIPYSTLAKHRHKTDLPRAGRKPVLSPQDEATLADFIKLSASCGEGLTMKDIVGYVQKFVVDAKIENPWKDNCPGIDWFKGFMQRHPKLAKRKAESMSSYRVSGSDPFVVNEFYDDLKALYQELGISKTADACRLYNCDETYFCHDPKNFAVIAEKGEKRISKNIAGSGKENTTVLACGSADGRKLPPLIVYSGTYVWSSWISDDDYPGTCYTAQKKGWMEGTLFCHWFEDLFLAHVPSKAERKGKKVVLFFDGASCHLNSRIVRKAKENDVVLVKLPPNVTQYLQPLDLCVFKPLKDEWEELVRKHNRNNSATVLDKKHFAALLKLAWEDGFKGRNIKSGFAATGLFPLDPKKFPQNAYSPDQLERYNKHKKAQLAKVQAETAKNPSTSHEILPRDPPTTSGETPKLPDSPAIIQQQTSIQCSTCNRALNENQAPAGQSAQPKLPAVNLTPASTEPSSSHELAANKPTTSSQPVTPRKVSTPRKTSTQKSTPVRTPSTPQRSSPRKSPKKGVPERRLSFEDFVRTQLVRNNRTPPTAPEKTTNRKKVSDQRGEILTSVTVLKRLEAAEKEKEEALKKREEAKKKREEAKKQKEEAKKQKEEAKKQKQEAKKNKAQKTTLKRKNEMLDQVVKKRGRRVRVISETSSEDADDPDCVDSEDSLGPEDFSELLDNQADESFSEPPKKVDIRLENYYAIYYDINWYLGRVIDFYDEDNSKIKFLKSNLETFVWPTSDDIQQVENCYIFYGPINLTGSGPFELKRSDRTQIKRKFSELKQNSKSK